LSEFTDYLEELFEEFGDVKTRRMFGGYGLFNEGLMFGLVANDTLYLKADELTDGEFKTRGLPQFEYYKLGKPARLSYYLAPEEILEDPEQAVLWAGRSYETALRQKK
jgi:DNA transformation protein